MNSTASFDPGKHTSVTFPEGLDLECGVHLAPLEVAYRTYGTLSEKRDNAIVICHALTGDQYVAESHPLTGKPGWWARMVGPGCPIDTDRFFVICPNVLGGCMGSTGPRSVRSDGKGNGSECWGTDFPPITVRDMVRAQHSLVKHLGIERLFAVVGGSMGGMQALEWAVTYPHMMLAVLPLATSPFHSAQNIAFNEVGRQSVFADPDWHGGRYWEYGKVPARGLAVARMMAHITYLSEEALTRKFGRRVRREQLASQAPETSLSMFSDIFEVESYLRYQGSSFVNRFDANSYLTITRAMDWFDLAAEHEGDLSAAFAGTPVRFCVVSFSSDWLFPTSVSRQLVNALNRVAANVSFVEIESDKGHDAFLLDEPDFDRTVRGFLCGVAEHAGLA
ncbi:MULTISPECIES: homoserine O-acetyltransferase MetX [Acetobacter]|uniref:homoserine O-acetyltransferase MetX n=1 Tax=Acetobacter TaxID=434 RepID=UPI000A362776|nr:MULTISPECIES: homoserine O-acetyltransferase [Acetobacter]MBS0959041.1 homoserine O-acetyltransferase [Acetobacter thailandicus]MBS0980395.1 homoserine O-acetyltransferase [Acetobacter thailandicus]MBS0985072.1 homoserine O-acetyltransferase [Acetobacter thailandicus]MBS1003389.1 homoserine O-acetyltransferase [Acetobacter thailandicus]OUI89655.1 homoserine acetyltransferase [Acetobacter sp. DmW_043]